MPAPVIGHERTGSVFAGGTEVTTIALGDGVIVSVCTP